MSSVIESVATSFAACFGAPPTVTVRSPGRVNLIGEHTDYSLLPVLPIAIDRYTLVAARATETGRVQARSLRFAGDVTLDREDLAPAESSARGERSGAAPPQWGRYLVGVLRELDGLASGRGAQLLLDGNLPTTGGLSSSSSLSMGLFAALDAIWELGLGIEALVARAIVAERHVGVESGGMDQTVIGLAQPGAALRIDFAPPGRQPVPLPDGLGLVAAFSGEEAPKGGSVRQAYNERVVGCRLAASLLARRLGLDPGSPPVLASVASAPDVAALAEELPERAAPEELARRDGLDLERIVQLTATRFDPRTAVLVRAVARHVLGEAARVGHAAEALRRADLRRFGALLDESHHSLAEHFRCSTPRLDHLCAAIREAGAYGARLTGAGFGGYALGAVAHERAAALVDAAIAATGGPAFIVRASGGVSIHR
jgi:galactokinase